MAGASIEIRVDDGLLAPLKILAGRLDDKTPLMAQISAYLVGSVQERFETGRAPGGQAWKVSLRAKLAGGQTLVDHGTLRDRITGDHGEDFAAVGTNDIRAAIHQFGGTIRAKGKALALRLPGANGLRMVKQVTMPARPFLGIDEADRAEISALVADYIAERRP